MTEVAIDPIAEAEKNAFEFSSGIFGFSSAKRFIVMNIPNGGDVFKQMMALDQPDLGFTLVYPYVFFPDYAPDIPDEEMREIGANSPDQVVLMAIANVPSSFKETTVNLKAPLVFNPHTKKARQVILSDDRYAVRQRLFKA